LERKFYKTLIRNFAPLAVFQTTMKNLLRIIAAVTLLLRPLIASTYSTEAIVAPAIDKGEYEVNVKVSRLEERDGKLVEKLISNPRIKAGLGTPASLYQGLEPQNPEYQTQENVRVEVSWPYPSESGMGFCMVTVKLGDKVVSKSKMQLQIIGKGRHPLILSPLNVDSKSVQVESLNGNAYVLLKFSGKTDEEAKRTAIENLGNQTRVCDAVGQVVNNGFVSGFYKEIGLTLQYGSEDEAKLAAKTLMAVPPQ
jgi:hypothetical protein